MSWRRPPDVPRLRRRRSRAGSIAAAVALAILLPAWQTPSDTQIAAAPIPSYTFGPTGLAGGGFQNVVVAAPDGTGKVLLGGDVSGFSRSLDRGMTWRPSSAGVPAFRMRSVASLAISPADPSKVYAGVGFQGTEGAFLASEDGGQTWAVRSTVPVFSGTPNRVAALPSPHPRSTGSLIAVDDGRSLLYAGTFDDGVMRSDDGGRTWTTIGLAGRYLRSLVIDPLDPDVLYVGTYGAGAWKATSASTDATFQQLPAAPTVVEELAFVGGTLYAAAGANGLFRVTDGGATWSALGAGTLPSPGPRWTAVGGLVGCDGTILYAGSSGGGVWSVARSADGGATWSSLATATIGTTIGGPGGRPWWLAPKRPTFLLGGSAYIAGQLAVMSPAQPCGPERVVLAGRSGVWATDDGGNSWYPMVEGLGTTIHHVLRIDPTNPMRVSTGVPDWGHIFSADGADHVTMAVPGTLTSVFDIAFDRSVSPSRVYIAAGNTDSNSRGEVYSSLDPLTRGWTDEGLSNVAGGKRPLGMALGRTSTGARVVVAAVHGGGVWRKVGTGAWKKSSGTQMSSAVQRTTRAPMAWPSGSATVYLYDRQTGIWRSNDAGLSWVKIWAKPSLLDMTGFVAAADGDPSTLYVSVGGEGLYRIDGATRGTVGSGLVPVLVGPATNLGPVAVQANTVVVARPATPSGTAELFRSDDRGASWAGVGDAFYQASALNPRDVAVAPDGTVYVATNGAGLIKGRSTG